MKNVNLFNWYLDPYKNRDNEICYQMVGRTREGGYWEFSGELAEIEYANRILVVRSESTEFICPVSAALAIEYEAEYYRFLVEHCRHEGDAEQMLKEIDADMSAEKERVGTYADLTDLF